MQPKRYSEYTPVPNPSGDSIVPIVEAGQNEVTYLKNLPVSTVVQAALTNLQSAIDAIQNTPVPLGYLIKSASGVVYKITIDEDEGLRTTLYNPATDGEMFAFGLLGVGIFE